MIGNLPKLNINVSPTDSKNIDKIKDIKRMSRIKGWNYYIDDNINNMIGSTDLDLYTIMKLLQDEDHIKFSNIIKQET